MAPLHLFAISLLVTVNLLAVSGDFNTQGRVTVINLETNDTLVTYLNEPAGFGPPFPEDGLEGRIVYADPMYGCGKLRNPAPPTTDKYVYILLISRGGNCQFADKVITAQKNNYSAALVHNNDSSPDCNGDLTIMGGANGSLVIIPSAFIGCRDGKELKEKYNYQNKKYIVRITGGDGIDYKMYLWPFAIVVAACFILVMVFLIIKFVRDHARQRMNRLSNRHLKKIPVRKFKKGDYYDTCAICLDEYEEGEKIRVLPCDHVYHTKCIDPWLTKNKKTCPVCKRRVIPGRDADSDSDASDSDGGGARGTSENTPLLGSSRSGSQYSRDQEAGTSTALPPASGAPAPSRATEVMDDEEIAVVTRLLEETERRGAQRQERRRRRRERRERQTQEGPENTEPPERREAEEDGVEEPPAAGSKSRKSSEHKKKKEHKRKRRVEAVEQPAEQQQQQRGLLVDVEEEEEGFVSAQSSFREDSTPPDSNDREVESDPLLGAVGGAVESVGGAKSNTNKSAKKAEDYINPSYSESQEVVATKGTAKKELNEVV